MRKLFAMSIFLLVYGACEMDSCVEVRVFNETPLTVEYTVFEKMSGQNDREVGRGVLPAHGSAALTYRSRPGDGEVKIRALVDGEVLEAFACYQTSNMHPDCEFYIHHDEILRDGEQPSPATPP